MKKALFYFTGFALVLTTYSIVIFHRGVLLPPKISGTTPGKSLWLPRGNKKGEIPIHQIVLEGEPYARGAALGQHTKTLLELQEKSLNAELLKFFPNMFSFRVFQFFLIQWFWGIDRFVDSWMLEEMYGVSLSTNNRWNIFSDSYTRQFAYHGLHEVGQMMVDSGAQKTSEGMACTVLAHPRNGKWILGRNFDFEAGRIFDQEKLIKWVFPETGISFVSVTWSGMVGVVTGINSKGLFLSLNAAGSDDFVRQGMPTTLVALKVLQFSENADQAIEILKNEKTFITDVFVLFDQRTQKLFRIEKSPKRTSVIEVKEASAITNHLISPTFSADRTNQTRMKNLTTLSRSSRGDELLRLNKADWENGKKSKATLLSALRDKGSALGNRKAIDPLIATHSVIYDSMDKTLWVSEGPSLTGQFWGFDLEKSFEERRPHWVGVLAQDAQASERDFFTLREFETEMGTISNLVESKKCDDAQSHFDTFQKSSSGTLKKLMENSYRYSTLLGDYSKKCKNDIKVAKIYWEQALAQDPAYRFEREGILKKLRSIEAK